MGQLKQFLLFFWSSHFWCLHEYFWEWQVHFSNSGFKIRKYVWILVHPNSTMYSIHALIKLVSQFQYDFIPFGRIFHYYNRSQNDLQLHVKSNSNCNLTGNVGIEICNVVSNEFRRREAIFFKKLAFRLGV